VQAAADDLADTIAALRQQIENLQNLVTLLAREAAEASK
jgi:hypothetical protein